MPKVKGHFPQDARMLVSKSLSGFTLIELMVTIAVVAILLTIAAPSFREIIQNNRIATQVNDLVSGLNLARSEAVKRGVRVTVCTSADGASCAGSGGWGQGWIVFVDSDNNAAVGSGEPILRVHAAVSSDITIKDNFSGYISYVSTGLTQQTGGGFLSGSLAMCDSSGVRLRRLIINSTGRARVCNPQFDSNCTTPACP